MHTCTVALHFALNIIVLGWKFLSRHWDTFGIRTGCDSKPILNFCAYMYIMSLYNVVCYGNYDVVVCNVH